MARRIRVWLIAAGAVIAVALTTAAAASATATFNVQTRTGFISRGEVVAGAGKGALQTNPMIRYLSTQSFTETCTFSDGTSVQAQGSTFFFLLFQAETRYAPGSSTIIGYTISPADIVDGETSDPDEARALCWEARGLPDDDSQITQTFDFGPKVSTLTFFGPNGAIALPFHS